jgi:hypothetical protein
MPIILPIWEAETRRVMVPAQSRQKVSETPISTNSWAQWHMPVISSYKGGCNREDCSFRLAPAKKKVGMGSIPMMAGSIKWRGDRTHHLGKITCAKRAGGVAQAVKRLSSKSKTLSSNNSITKKTKKQKTKYLNFLEIKDKTRP